MILSKFKPFFRKPKASEPPPAAGAGAAKPPKEANAFFFSSPPGAAIGFTRFLAAFLITRPAMAVSVAYKKNFK